MKRIVSVIFAAVILAAASASMLAGGKEKASMKFEETTHDFGTIKEEGGAVTCEFPFVNEGKANLIIFNASAECGCTRPSYPKNPIAPGKGGKITVTYNPLGRPGAFSKVVTIKTNGKPAKLHLKVRGSVMPKSK